MPKSQLNSTTYKSTRVNDQWERPAAAGTYHLRVEGNNASHVVSLDIPAPADSLGKGTSGGLQPTDFRAAPESLTLQGALATTITTGRPSMCGAGSGPDGIMLFAFATYFEANGNWYWLLLSTDPSVQTYKGPGTYTIPAYLYTVGPLGPDQPLYKGTAQLTVGRAQFPDFDGSVQATLNGLEIVGANDRKRRRQSIGRREGGIAPPSLSNSALSGLSRAAAYCRVAAIPGPRPALMATCRSCPA